MGLPETPDMTRDERRRVLSAIARDPEAYPRDKIAAVRALEEMDRDHPPVKRGMFDDLDELTPRRLARR